METPDYILKKIKSFSKENDTTFNEAIKIYELQTLIDIKTELDSIGDSLNLISQ